jgi:hypothetical protein
MGLDVAVEIWDVIQACKVLRMIIICHVLTATGRPGPLARFVSTANLPDDKLEPMTSTVKTGIYFGYAQVHRSCPQGQAAALPEDDLKVWPMVMSLGWNPFYKNEKLTAVSLN